MPRSAHHSQPTDCRRLSRTSWRAWTPARRRGRSCTGWSGRRAGRRRRFGTCRRYANPTSAKSALRQSVWLASTVTCNGRVKLIFRELGVKTLGVQQPRVSASMHSSLPADGWVTSRRSQLATHSGCCTPPVDAVKPTCHAGGERRAHAPVRGARALAAAARRE